MSYHMRTSFAISIMIIVLLVPLESVLGETTGGDVVLSVWTAVNIGATLGNGVALFDGNPNFFNGFLGFLVGAGAVSVAVAAQQDDQDLGNVGTAFAVTGVTAAISGVFCMVLHSRDGDDRRSKSSKNIFKNIDVRSGNNGAIGLEVRFGF